jgi:hypothetical protein
MGNGVKHDGFTFVYLVSGVLATSQKLTLWRY